MWRVTLSNDVANVKYECPKLDFSIKIWMFVSN